MYACMHKCIYIYFVNLHSYMHASGQVTASTLIVL